MTVSATKIKRIELKFQLRSSISAEVQCWARENLSADPHCPSGGDDSYNISSLYLDTAERDILRCTGKVGRSKHRIRRYGNENALWVETKRKKKTVVRKKRTFVDRDIFFPACPPVQDESWFVDRISQRQLCPAVQLSYRRFARTSENGQYRLTIDSKMCAQPTNGWAVSPASSFDRSFGESDILELKFNGAMPVLFKRLLQTFTIPASGFSKYSAAMAVMDDRSANIAAPNVTFSETESATPTNAGQVAYA